MWPGASELPSLPEHGGAVMLHDTSSSSLLGIYLEEVFPVWLWHKVGIAVKWALGCPRMGGGGVVTAGAQLWKEVAPVDVIDPMSGAGRQEIGGSWGALTGAP